MHVMYILTYIWVTKKYLHGDLQKLVRRGGARWWGPAAEAALNQLAQTQKLCLVVATAGLPHPRRPPALVGVSGESDWSPSGEGQGRPLALYPPWALSEPPLPCAAMLCQILRVRSPRSPGRQSQPRRQPGLSNAQVGSGK